MELDILLIFDRERFWRRAKLDLDSLASCAAEMPESISGTIIWVDGDMFLIDQSKKRARSSTQHKWCTTSNCRIEAVLKRSEGRHRQPPTPLVAAGTI